MFRTAISSTPFTGEIADSYFTNITGSSVGVDNSFLATIRAMIGPRMSPNEEFTFLYATTRVRYVNEKSKEEIVESAFADTTPNDHGRLILYNTSFNQYPEVVMDAIEEKLVEVYPGFYREKKIEAFFVKGFKLLVFINPELKSTVLVMNSDDLRKVHWLQSALYAYLPWYSPYSEQIRPDPETDDFYRLSRSLCEQTEDNYLAILSKMAEELDFRTPYIQKALSDFETAYERNKLHEVETKISDLDSRIDGYFNEIHSLNASRRDLEITLTGLQTKIQNGDGRNEIMGFFLRNPLLNLLSVEGDTIYYYVKDYINQYDMDAAKSIIGNTSSVLYDEVGSWSRNNAKKFLTALFLDKKVRLRTVAAYQFSLSGYFDAVRNYNFPIEVRDCMPNTHIQYFGCPGGHRHDAEEALRAHDYISVFEISIASAMNMCFDDSTVMRKFSEVVFSRECGKCIELEDGSIVTPREALNWINAMENEDEEEQQDE